MRKPPLRAWALACLGLLALPSCYRPHYDPALDASARFEHGLEKTARLGPFQINSHDDRAWWFIPDRRDTPGSGWLANYQSSNFALTYLDNSGFGAINGYWGMAMGEDSFVLPMTDIEASGLSTATPPTGYLFMGDCEVPGSYLGTNAVGMDATYTGMASQDPTLVSAPNASYGFVGGSLAPYMVPTSDCLTLALAWDDGGSLHLAAGHGVIANNAALGAYSVATTEFTVYPGPKLREGAFMAYHGGSGRYYLSAYAEADGSLYTCYWPNTFAAPILLPSIDTKISALLSDGRLLARNGSITKLYSGNGELEANLYTGSLRFCYEIYSGGIYYSVFSRTFMIQDGNDYSRAKLYAEAFRVPTADLASLGD